MSDTTRDAKPLFFQALDLPAEEREAFIRRAAGGNEEIASRAMELLRSYEEAGTFLHTPTNHVSDEGGSSSTPPTPLPAPDALSEIGHYRLIRRLGEGHYGEVFEAEQTDPVTRRVAIKLLKRGVDSRQTLARFQAERQAVASLDHPNISRFLDAGETEDGRPYFVMDLVRGLSINEYADTNHLSIPRPRPPHDRRLPRRAARARCGPGAPRPQARQHPRRGAR